MKKYLKFIILCLIPIVSIIIYHYYYQYQYYLTARQPYQFTIIWYIVTAILMGFYLSLEYDKKIFIIVNIVYIILFLMVLLYSIGVFMIPYGLFVLFGYAQNLTAVWIGIFICKIIILLMEDLLKKNNGPFMLAVSSILPIITIIFYDYLYWTINKAIYYDNYESVSSIDDLCLSYGVFVILALIMGLYICTIYDKKKLLLMINMIYVVLFIILLVNLLNIRILPDIIYMFSSIGYELIALWIGIFICKIIFIIKDDLYEKSL